jgi:hypothetical protein
MADFANTRGPAQDLDTKTSPHHGPHTKNHSLKAVHQTDPGIRPAFWNPCWQLMPLHTPVCNQGVRHSDSHDGACISDNPYMQQ